MLTLNLFSRWKKVYGRGSFAGSSFGGKIFVSGIFSTSFWQGPCGSAQTHAVSGTLVDPQQIRKPCGNFLMDQNLTDSAQIRAYPLQINFLTSQPGPDKKAKIWENGYCLGVQYLLL